MREGREQVVDGIRIRMGVSGEPPRVVLLHGLGNSLEMWHMVGRHLDSLVPWVAIDIPGFGKSSRLENENLGTVTAALAELFARMGWVTPHLVGHSMGGIVAWALAAWRPGAIGSLSLVSAPPIEALGIVERPCHMAKHPRVALNLLQQIVGGSLPVPTSLRDAAFSSRSMRRLLLSPYVANPSSLDGADVSFALAETGGLAATRAILANSALDLDLMAAKTNCPVSVIVGEKDKLMTAGDLSWARENLRANVRILADCGHWPHIEQPLGLARIIGGASR